MGPPPPAAARALAALERRAAQRSLNGDADWTRDAAFRADVKHVKRLLEEEQADEALLERAEALTRKLDVPDVPAFVRTAAAAAAAAAPPPAEAIARIEFLLGCAPANDAHEGRADAIARGAATLRQRRAKANATKADPRGVVPIDDATAARLEAQAKVQDSLTDDLVDLVSEFKTGAQEVQRRLGDRAMLLDETEEALEKSSAHAKQKVRGAKNLLETNAGGLGTCTMLLIVLGVLAVFTWVFVLIRFTSVKRIK